MDTSRDSRDKKRDKERTIEQPKPFEIEWHAVTATIRSIQKDDLGGTLKALFQEINPKSAGEVAKKNFSTRVPSPAVRQAVIDDSASYFHKQDKSKSVQDWRAFILKSAHERMTREALANSRVGRIGLSRGDVASSGDFEWAREKLIDRLKRDQSESGFHLGQFGKTTDPDNEKRFVTGSEEISTKPRIYLTAWPAVVLSSHDLLSDQVALAIDGICALFRQNRIRVFQAAPQHSPPHLEASLISYRHTIGAALLLHGLRGWQSIVRNVVDNMLDQRNRWQNADGGWAQCDREHIGSDIWCSAYAIRLLKRVLGEGAVESQIPSIESRIDPHLPYIGHMPPAHEVPTRNSRDISPYMLH